MTEYHSFIVEQSYLRLDQYLAGKLPDFSRSKIQNFIKLGQVTIDGEPVKSSLILQGKEAIECHFEPELQNDSIIGEVMSLEILYEDDFLAVINKPAGLVVHPGSGNHTGTLLNGLIHHFQKLSHKDSHRPGIVHRLDKGTSGLILVAKNDKVHDALSLQFNQRKVKKEYLAMAWGKLEEKGMIEGAIGRHPRNRQLFTMVDQGGRESSSQYKLEGYFPPFSWVRLYPKTGRTHQLRVHLKSIGHPIFCDDAYGGGAKYARSFHVKYTQIINRLIKTVNRVALHAHRLEISHPVTKKKMVFESVIPQDLQRALEILKNG